MTTIYAVFPFGPSFSLRGDIGRLSPALISWFFRVFRIFFLAKQTRLIHTLCFRHKILKFQNYQKPYTPSYTNKHNVSLQYIVQFSKLLSKMWLIFTNCFWVQIFKNLKFLKFEWKFRHQILGKIIKIIIQIYWQNMVPKFQPKFEIW